MAYRSSERKVWLGRQVSITRSSSLRRSSRSSPPIRTQLTPFDQTVQRFFVSMLPALQVAMLATKLYGLRLALWLSAIVPIALGYAVGMIDGLVERSIRRYSGGRESATLYHRAKYAIAGAVGLWLFVYVCVPMTFELQWGSWVAAGGDRSLVATAMEVLQEIRLIGCVRFAADRVDPMACAVVRALGAQNQ